MCWLQGGKKSKILAPGSSTSCPLSMLFAGDHGTSDRSLRTFLFSHEERGDDGDNDEGEREPRAVLQPQDCCLQPGERPHDIVGKLVIVERTSGLEDRRQDRDSQRT